MKRFNQSGAVILNVIVASLVVAVLSGVVMQQAGRTQNYSRLARVKSAMFATEVQLRSIIIEPSSYRNCDGSNAATCEINTDLFTTYRNPVPGAKCPGAAGCGIVVRQRPGVPFFNSATRRFNANIHYEGTELALRDIEVTDFVVPTETLVQSAMVCPNSRPIFRGMVNGLPQCDPLPAQCGPRQWMTSVNPQTLVPTCASYPESITCPTGQYISGINYSATGITATCAPRADIYVFNSNPGTGTPYAPGLTSGPPITLKPPKPAPTPPTPKPPLTFIGVDSSCYPTMALCEAAEGAGNCAASSQNVLRAVSGEGGATFLQKMCDINYPGSLREMSCTAGSSVYIWDACRYDGYGDVDWNPPYMRTNYTCQVKQYCATATPPPPTTPPSCIYSCTHTNAECSPGPAAGCSYSAYVTASGDRNRVGEGCSSRYFFRRTGGGVVCDQGFLECDCGGTTPTMPPATTPPTPTLPPTPPTTPPAPPPPPLGSCPDECPAYERGGQCNSVPVQGGCRVDCTGEPTIWYLCR